MAYPNDQDRRRYEAAILAALDFEPTVDSALDFEPIVDPPVPAERRRPQRRALRLVGLAVAHFVFALTFAAALAAGRTGWPLLVAALAWLGGTVLIIRTALQAGRRSAVERPPG